MEPKTVLHEAGTLHALTTAFHNSNSNAALAEAYGLLFDVQRIDNPATNEQLAAQLAPLAAFICRDLTSKDEEIAGMALKSLGYLIHHPNFVSALSDEQAARILSNLVKVTTTTNVKALCNLAVWCISVQQFKLEIVGKHFDDLIAAVMHAIDNPMGSKAVTYEAFQALYTLAKQRPSDLRKTSPSWAPKVYRRLLTIDKNGREMAQQALQKLIELFQPPPLALSEVVARDITQDLLSEMKRMVTTKGLSLVAVNGWGWFVRLLGSLLSEKRQMLNEMLKIVEISFLSVDVQVRIASQVQWETLIHVLVKGWRGKEALSSTPPNVCTPHLSSMTSTQEPIQPPSKILNLLMMPLLNTVETETDNAVKRTSWKTWLHFLQSLGQLINKPTVFSAVASPMFELVFKLGPQKAGSFIWLQCQHLVIEYVKSRVPDGLDSNEFLYPSDLLNPMQNVASDSVLASSDHVTIKWEAWSLCEVDKILKLIDYLCRHLLQQTSDENPKNICLHTSNTIWSLIVKAIEADQRDVVTPSCQHVAAVHSLLKFIARKCEADVYCAQSKHIVSWLWMSIKNMLDEMHSLILSSSFYKINPMLMEQHCGELPALVPKSPSIQRVSSLKKSSDLISPIIFLATAWLKMCSKLTVDKADEEVMIARYKALLESASAGFDRMGNLHGLSTIFFPLAFCDGEDDKLEHEESSIEQCKETQGCYHRDPKSSVFLLKAWKAFVQHFRSHIENINDIPAINDGFADSGYQVAYNALIFPLKYFLLWSEDISKICSIDTNEIENLKSLWVQLYITTLRISSLKNSQPYIFSGCLFLRILKLLDSHRQTKDCSMFSIIGQHGKIPRQFLELLGCAVASVFKQAETGTSTTLVINRNRRLSSNSSTGFHCLSETDNSSYMKNVLSVATRFLILSLLDNPSEGPVFETLTRVLDTVAGYAHRAYTQNESLWLFNVLEEILVHMLGSCTETANSKPLPANLLPHIERLWDGILTSLQRATPPIKFDSSLLETQARCLALALRHFNASIANRTFSFWEATYGRLSCLKYPTCLVSVFLQLKQKVSVSLPSWAVMDHRKSLCKDGKLSPHAISMMQDSNTHKAKYISQAHPPSSPVRISACGPQRLKLGTAISPNSGADAVDKSVADPDTDSLTNGGLGKESEHLEFAEEDAKSKNKNNVGRSGHAGTTTLPSTLPKESTTATKKSLKVMEHRTLCKDGKLSPYAISTGQNSNSDKAAHLPYLPYSPIGISAGGLQTLELGISVSPNSGADAVDKSVRADQIPDALTNGHLMKQPELLEIAEEDDKSKSKNNVGGSDDASAITLVLLPVLPKESNTATKDGTSLKCDSFSKSLELQKRNNAVIIKEGTQAITSLQNNAEHHSPDKDSTLQSGFSFGMVCHQGTANRKSTESADQELQKTLPGRKNPRFTKDDDDYVIICSAEKRKKPVLTEHQKEVRRAQQRQGPGIKTYTTADFSQSLAFGDSEDMETVLEASATKELCAPSGMNCVDASVETNVEPIKTHSIKPLHISKRECISLGRKISLRSSGRLRGGKNWRSDSQSKLASLAMKRCSQLKSKDTRSKRPIVNEDLKDLKSGDERTTLPTRFLTTADQANTEGSCKRQKLDHVESLGPNLPVGDMVGPQRNKRKRKVPRRIPLGDLWEDHLNVDSSKRKKDASKLERQTGETEDHCNLLQDNPRKTMKLRAGRQIGRMYAKRSGALGDRVGDVKSKLENFCSEDLLGKAEQPGVTAEPCIARKINKYPCETSLVEKVLTCEFGSLASRHPMMGELEQTPETRLVVMLATLATSRKWDNLSLDDLAQAEELLEMVQKKVATSKSKKILTKH